MAFELTLTGAPRTKKNSQRIVNVGGFPKILPSAQYLMYEKECIEQILQHRKRLLHEITGPVNVCCVYYMPSRRRVDLVNLLEATDDILVSGGILEDDNCRIIASHDGSRVDYDKENPRVEITIGGPDDEHVPFYP